MSQREYSRYQQNVIKRYYENLDSISLQKLQELVTELYLAETDAQRSRLWDRVAKAMAKLQVPSAIYDNILAKRDPKVLAMNLEDWLKQARG